jgi:hypothetical protein
MARSLRIAIESIAEVKAARNRCGFVSMQALVSETEERGGDQDVEYVSYTVVKNFFKGEAVDRKKFVCLCKMLRLDWQEVAAKEAEADAGNTWEDSPFVVGPPITKPRQFFGRERELRRLFNLLKRLPLQNAAIIGPRRSGKTSLLYYLKSICTTPESELRPGQKNDWLPNPERYCWVYVDFQDVRVQSRAGLMAYLLAGMGMALPEGGEPSLEQFMDVVSQGLKQPTVILMDEVGVVLETKDGLARCPELDYAFWESLRSLATTQTRGMLGFVLATPENPVELAKNNNHSSPFFNIFGYLAPLGSLMGDEAEELIEVSEIDLTPEGKAWILEKSQSWPILLQMLCREYYFAQEDGLSKKELEDSSVPMFSQYQHLLRAT